jgi:Bacterial Ig-like domain
MNFNRIISSAILVLVIAISVTSGPGCANIIPPSGGPRDSIPPVLISAKPVDSAKNFTGNRIEFTFDEFIDVTNVIENLLVSPTPKEIPNVTFKLKTMTVKLKDTLEPNTTYSLNFGNAIKDYTESNVMKGFTYTFSTGRYIDSLELRGKVVMAETGKVDTTLIVMLHTDKDDSALIRQKPRYIAKLDGKGNFVFKNLPSRTFYIYALKDEGGTRRYFSDKQLFAFADSAINIGPQNKSVTLYAFAGQQAKLPNVSNLNIGNRNRRPDGTTDKRLKYQTNLGSGLQDLFGTLIITFETTLRSFDSSKIRLYTDTLYTPAASYKFAKDSTNQKVLLTHTWKPSTLYHIILEKDFAEDSSGRKLLKTDTISFQTKRLADYGTLKLKFRNLDISKNPVLQFIQNDNIYKSFPLTGAEFTQPLFLPGEYEMRILYDDNKNGVWDPGVFFIKHKQPEIVKPIERRITIKPNWQNEFEIAL